MGHTVYCLVPASSPPPLMYVCVVIGGVLEDLSKQPCPSDRCEPSALNGWVPTEVPAISQLGKSEAMGGQTLPRSCSMSVP